VRIRTLAYSTLALFLFLTPAAAQTYPAKPVRIVVGFAAGSVSDLMARVIGQKLAASLGQPFIVEVRPGAGSNVAAQYVVRSPKDGYTLFVASSSSTIRGGNAASLGFDFATDLDPVANLASVPFVLAAYPGLGVKTLKEFIALAKAKPDTLTFGGTAVGTTGYLAAQMFNQRAGTNLVIAPYPSTAQATTDLMTGRISIAFASASNVLQLVQSGKLVALAVAQSKRAAMIRDVPTVDEAGLPGVDSSIWIGMLTPAGTPRPIVATLSKAVNEALRSDDVVRQMRVQGLVPLGGTPEEFGARIKSDIARWDTVLKAAGLVK
jgi:tripartite-type tricarboxylate transporter receptor subunit TctC